MGTQGVCVAEVIEMLRDAYLLNHPHRGKTVVGMPISLSRCVHAHVHSFAYVFMQMALVLKEIPNFKGEVSTVLGIVVFASVMTMRQACASSVHHCIAACREKGVDV